MNKKYCDICEKEMKEDSWIQVSFSKPSEGLNYLVVNQNPYHKIDACKFCIKHFVEHVSEFLSP